MSEKEGDGFGYLVPGVDADTKGLENGLLGCSSLVTNIRELAEMQFTETEEQTLIERFGKAAHTDGLTLFRHGALDTINALCAGRVASKHFDALGGKGKDSRFGIWCETYGGAVSRTTIDRWRRMYEAFRNDFDKNPQLFSNVQLSALYWLVENGVSESQRASIFEIAKSQKPVTKSLVKELVPKKTHPKGKPRLRFPKKEKPSSRHFVCDDKSLAKAIRVLDKAGYKIISTVVSCFNDSEGRARHLTLVSGVKNSESCGDLGLGSWFSVENLEDAHLECKAQVRERFGESALERFSVFK